MSASQEFLNKLENARKSFTNDPFPLENRQEKAIKKYVLLLSEKRTTQSLPSSTRYTRDRARQLLIDIYKKIDPDVFILCTLAATITALGSIPANGLILELYTWWLSKSHPAGLSQVTRLVCTSNSIDSLVNDPSEVGQSVSLECEGVIFVSFCTA